MTRIAGGPTIESRSLALGRESSATLLARVPDYLELTKPRIVFLELVTVAVAARVAAPRSLHLGTLLVALAGAALVAASAGAFNQWLEQHADARMRRTARRPLPAGRLSASQVIIFGVVTLIVGLLQLIWFVNLTTAMFGLTTWLIYVAIYTPLKSRSPLNTAVGAVSGALPVLMGWSATGTPLDYRALAMAAVLFLWQFPHFMAIAWLYRSDYARAGHKMLTIVDPTGLRAGAQAVTAAAMLMPASLVIALGPQSGSPAVYCMWALLLSAGQLVAAMVFLCRRDDGSARRLLRASLLYLPSWMGLLAMLSV
jgi:protoheme IX farnesyltransferase